MATTVFTYTVPEYITLRDNAADIVVCTLTRTSGDAVPPNAVISSASISVSKVHQFSSWRDFRIHKDDRLGVAMSGALNTTGKAYDSSGEPVASSNTWEMHTDASLYTDLTTIAFASVADRSGSHAIMGLLKDCVVTVTVVYTALPVLDEDHPVDVELMPNAVHQLEVVFKQHGAPASYTYQWYRNGTAIKGATERTIMVSPSMSSPGAPVTYYCEVTHQLGTVRSRVSSVTMTSCASVWLDETFRHALPYLYINGTWVLAIAYVFVDGAFRAAALTNYKNIITCGNILCGEAICGEVRV